jgi:hypothetical protein
MKDRVSGTIVVIDTVPPRLLRPRVLWHLATRPAPAGYLEARPWTQDPITREYHEGSTVILACSVEGARRLMPRGLVEVDTDGTNSDGWWYSAPRAARRERAA